MEGDDKDDALGWQELLETAGGGVEVLEDDDLEYETHHRATRSGHFSLSLAK